MPRKRARRARDAECRAAEFALIYPAYDTRGPAAERLRSWTHGQTLARERYRVVVAVDGEIRKSEVKPLLAPHDVVIVVPGANEVAMWNAAAARAGTRWLIMAEGHCIADPDCLEAVAGWVAANPNAVAGSFAVGHPADYRMARLSERWFAQMHNIWGSDGEWDRLTRAGFVIHAEAFEAAGGFVPDAGQFAVPLLAAQLNDGGHAIDRVSGAQVVHVDTLHMRDHHIDTADFVQGECAARGRFDQVFFERYFGHDPMSTNRLRERRDVAWRMLCALAAAIVARPRHAPELIRLLPALAVRAGAGARLRVAIARFAVLLDEFAVDRLPLPGAIRWWRYLRAHRRVVALTRLDWSSHRIEALAAPPDWDALAIEEAGAETLAGVHGLEESGGHRFRWSEPVVLLRLAPSPERRILTIDTGGIRGDPGDSALSATVDGRSLSPGALTNDGTRALRVAVPASPDGASVCEVILIVKPLIPARAGTPDARLLGLPIVSLAIEFAAR